MDQKRSSTPTPNKRIENRMGELSPTSKKRFGRLSRNMVKSKSHPELFSFENCLNSEEQMTPFFAFLCKIHCEETYLFYKDVKAYGETLLEEHRIPKAYTIFHTYLERNAIKKINVDQLYIGMVEQDIKKNLFSQVLFQNIQQQIISLLKNLYYLRYIENLRI